MQLDWDWNLAWRSLPHLLNGLQVTVLATIGGMILALVLGLILATLRRAGAAWISWPVAMLIEFVRSTPLLIQLFFIYLFLPQWLWFGALPTGILAIGIHYSSYTSEVYRAGIDGVGRGQWEAATALNLPRWIIWTRIIVPQALPPIIPAMGNYLIAMMKDTPMLFAITVTEMLSEANNFSSRTGSYVESYTMVGLLFLILSLLSSRLVYWSEKRVQRREE